jgi:hypothetical protein
MKPYMKDSEIELFKKYLKQSNNYLEYGSGGSTLFAIENNIKNIFSIETDKEWYNKLMNHDKIKNFENINIQLIDLKCIWWEYVSWCREKKDINRVKNPNFYKYVIAFKDINFDADLVLIDGRFRVCCLLNLYDFLNLNTIILFHDYTTRPFYHVIENFYEKIEANGSLQVLKKKENINIELLEKLKDDYKLIID